MTLRDLLVRRIRRDGALSVADFMGLALFHPKHGYYMRHVPVGRTGDYVTAPEIHQMFGEIITAWLIDYWQRCDRPTPFLLIELGPGRGTLMQDILRTASAVAPHFARAARIWFVEISPTLRGRQAVAVPAARFADELAAVPAGFSLVVANEFFDALPVHQYVKSGGHWHERLVTWNPSTARFAFMRAPQPTPVGPRLPSPAEEGEIAEVSLAGQAMVADLARRAVAEGGVSLILDYARDSQEPSGTLQAVRAHRSVDPLEDPGASDLSVRVDFDGLAAAARAVRAAVYGPRGQGAFLDALCIRRRAARLAVPRAADRADAEAALWRLTHPDGMGTRFRALAITGPDAPPPTGFT